MKKIFILFGLLSALLCSCASTSLTEIRYGNTDTKVSKKEVEWFFNQEYWTTENYLMRRPIHILYPTHGGEVVTHVVSKE